MPIWLSFALWGVGKLLFPIARKFCPWLPPNTPVILESVINLLVTHKQELKELKATHKKQRSAVWKNQGQVGEQNDLIDQT